MAHCTITGSCSSSADILIHTSMSITEINAINRMLEVAIKNSHPLNDYENLIIVKEFCLKLHNAAAQFRKMNKLINGSTPDANPQSQKKE